MTDLLTGPAATPRTDEVVTSDLAVRPTPRRTLVERAVDLLDRGPSRRSLLVRAAVIGSALTVSPLRFLLRPGTAYAAVCGIDSACSSGYTVFCATINDGVNACPSGSLVGGWWKSDGSGFCCGNARYYIDCHSYCSCGCESGRSFCGEGCRNCSCGCGPGGQCDQRRVCCNNFRYGQCMQHVSCTGPVWCRVVTCTPPWKVPAWACSTTSAVDQRTNAHGAPALEDCTPIGAKYTSVGGQSSTLGEPVTGERRTPDGVGRYNHFQGGSIYWHPDTGAHSIWGSIRDRWEQLRWESGPLGYPRTDETATPDGVGRFNHFQGGSIYWHPSTGAHSIWGSIRDRWKELRWELGPLGYPRTDETATPDGVGRYNHFQGGSIYWHPDTGAHAVWGAIRGRWEALRWESGPLGYPTTDETATPDGVGRFNRFMRGTVYWHPSTGAHAVWGAIGARYDQLRRTAGPLGFPTTDELPAAGGRGRHNDFQNGSVYWSAATGAHSVLGRVRAAWLERGGAAGALGLPTSEPYADGGLTRSDFQGGYITEDPRTGTVVVHERER